MAIKEAILVAALSTSPEAQGNKQDISELLNSQKNIVSKVVESKQNPGKIDANLAMVQKAMKMALKDPIKYDISKLSHTAQNNIVLPTNQEVVSDVSPKLSDEQVLDRYKQILNGNDDDNELMDDYEVYYEDFIGDMNIKARKLVIEIYNENQSGFESLGNTVKAQVYNAIFYAAASISKPEIYGGITAKEKLNTAMSIIVGGKLSQLKSFFDTHGEEFEKLAKDNSKELKKKLAKIAQKEEKYNRYSEKVDRYSEKVDRYSEKVDNLTEMVKQLQGLLD